MPVALGLVSFRIFPTHMGGQKGVAMFYKYLKERMTVLLAVSRDNQQPDNWDMDRLLYPNKAIYLNLFQVGRLKRIIHRKGIALVIAEHSYTGWIAWLLKKPFILHSHNIESRRFKQMHRWWWWIYQAYEGWIHRKAIHSFFISQEDMDLAINSFHLDAAHCSVITYGVEPKNVDTDKAALKQRLGLDPAKKMFLFNGTLDYQPNYDAVITIIEKIDPLLQQYFSNYQVIITGNRAPHELAKKIMACPNIQYTGYVDDVDLYYQAADFFLNPVSNDTGVKTKLIEAIANNCTAVSTNSGASGIAQELCGKKLVCVADGDWNSFVNQLVQLDHLEHENTPPEFYDYYDWRNIAARAADKLKELATCTEDRKYQ